MKKTLLLLLFIFSLKLNAQNTEFQIADSLMLKGRYTLALQLLKNTKPTDAATNLKIGTIYYTIENYNKAIDYLKKSLDTKHTQETNLLLAKCYQKTKSYNNAISIYEEITTEQTNNLLAHYQLAKLYTKVKKFQKAIEIFKTLALKDKKNANYSYQLALTYAKTNKRNAMIDSFLDCYEKDSTHINAIYQLTNCYTSLKDQDSTALFLEKGLKLAPNHINLNKLKINQLYRQKKYALAIPFLNKIDSFEPKDHFTNSMLGKCHYRLEEFELARDKFKLAARIDHEDFKSYTYLGHVSMALKEYKQARFDYTWATSRGKKKRDEAYYGLGTVYLETNKKSEAIAMFKLAIKENRKNYKALYQLALTEDSFYKDKKIAYAHYKSFIEKFRDKDKNLANYSKRRISEIKKEYFMKNEPLE